MASVSPFRRIGGLIPRSSLNLTDILAHFLSGTLAILVTLLAFWPPGELVKLMKVNPLIATIPSVIIAYPLGFLNAEMGEAVINEFRRLRGTNAPSLEASQGLFDALSREMAVILFPNAPSVMDAAIGSGPGGERAFPVAVRATSFLAETVLPRATKVYQRGRQLRRFGHSTIGVAVYGGLVLLTGAVLRATGVIVGSWVVYGVVGIAAISAGILVGYTRHKRDSGDWEAQIELAIAL